MCLRTQKFLINPHPLVFVDAFVFLRSIGIDWYREMIQEHMPEDVFKAYAAPEPEDETKRISARSLAIAVMMQEDVDNIVPKDEETYR